MADTNFIDYMKIFCRSGNGGAGAMHFHRDKQTRLGGPDGGNGGHGGSIIVKGNAQLWTLIHLKYQRHIFAVDGKAGGSALMTGHNGANATIEVPLGTVVKNAETGEFIFEITEHDEMKTLVPGGRGGMGNDHFKTSTHQAPKFSQPGEKGSEDWYIFELKILADVGLVGFPNAGKSTLLSVVSAAKPKIADYPFTTLVPNLGIVKYRDNLSFVMADIPGIIEGAHEGRGLGLRFLRHIERNSLLLFMVPVDAKDIKTEYNILLGELQQFNPELLDKKRVLAITKCDMADEELMKEMKKGLPKKLPTVFISSIANINVDKLKDMLWKELHDA